MPEKKSSTQQKAETAKKPVSLARNPFVHIAILLILTTVLFGKFLFSEKMLSSSDQLTGIDSRVILRNALVEDGQFPTWFSSRLGGMPSIDAMFGDAMYLPSLLIYAAFPMQRALGMIMVFHVALAGIFFYLMMVRGFKAHPLVALISSSLYMLNPEFVSHVYPGHSGKMMVIAWLPFVIWRMKMLMDLPTLLNCSLLALGIASCLFTSHTQMTYFVLWGLFLYWAMSLVLAWREHHDIKKLMPAGLFFWAAVFLGVGMAFIQFFPSFMFIREAFSVRGVDKGFEYAASWSLHWPEFFSLWVPEFGNFLDYYWSENPFKLNTEYAGLVVVILGVFAVVHKPKPWRIFWAAVAVFAVFYGMGKHTPVFHIAYYLIPGVKKFRACSMMLFWYSFGTAILSALFLCDVARNELRDMDDKRKKKWQKGILIACGAMTLVAVLFSSQGFVAGIMGGVLADTRKAQIFEMNFSKNFVPALWIWWVSAVIITGIVWAEMNKKVAREIFYIVVLAVGVFDTLRVSAKFIKVINPNQYFYAPPALTGLQTRMKEKPFRCFTFPGTFNNNAEGIYGLEGVGGFHDNELQYYRAFRGDQRNTNYFHGILMQDANGRAYLNAANLRRGNNFLNIANVKYYLTGQGGSLSVLENQGALGRISFVPNFLVMNDNTAAIHALRTNAYDIRHTIALAEEPADKPAPFVIDTSDSMPRPLPQALVAWEEYTVNYRKARVAVPRDGFLRISEAFYPGWEIRIDGKKQRIYRADVAWMAVHVEAGEHTVEMMPKSLYLGKASLVSFPLIILALLYWAAIAVAAYRKKQSGAKAAETK